jgi:hypothetical protein
VGYKQKPATSPVRALLLSLQSLAAGSFSITRGVLYYYALIRTCSPEPMSERR